MRHSSMSTQTGQTGLILAVVGGAGWMTTENILYLLPILCAMLAAFANMVYAFRTAKARAAFDLRVYKIQVAKEMGIELKVLEPVTMDPDQELSPVFFSRLRGRRSPDVPKPGGDAES